MRRSKTVAYIVCMIFYASVLARAENFDWAADNITGLGASSVIGDFTLGSEANPIHDLITKGPWVDVRAFGAVLDNTTDDSAAFIRSVNAANPNGTIVIPGPMAIGSNGWTGINLTGLTNVTIRGEKGGGIKLLFLPSQSYTHYSSIVALKISNSTGVTVRDLDFDGNNLKSGLLGFDNVSDSYAAHNTLHTLEYNDVARPLIFSDAGTRNRFTYNDFKGGCYQLGVGLNSDGLEKHSSVSFNTFRNPRGCLSVGMAYGTVQGNIFNGCDVGVNIGTLATYPSHDLSIIGNSAFNCSDNATGSPGAGSGIRTDSGGTNTLNGIYNMSVIGNTIDNCSNGINTSGAGYTSISGNVIRLADVGIAIGLGTNISITGNIIKGGRGYDNNYAGIFLSGALSVIQSNITIASNIISDFYKSTQNGLIIQETASSYYNRVNITNNIFDNNYTGINLYNYGDYQNVSGNIFNGGTFDIFEQQESGTTYGINNLITSSVNLSSPLKYKLNSKTMSNHTAAPTDNTVAWTVGDIVWNTAADNVIGWKCTTAGSPGTWKAMTVTMP